MKRYEVGTIVGLVVALACVAKTGEAQTQAPNATPPSRDQSAAAAAQEASNPFATSWLISESCASAAACRRCSRCSCSTYPIRPSSAAPEWNLQLQVTPTIPALIKKALF